MLTPDLRHLMELPSPTSPTVDLFPMHEKSRDHQISEANLVDSEQLLTPDGAVRPLQELGSQEQAVSNMPAARSPTPASPTTEPVFKNSQVFIETLKAEVDTQEQALTVPVTDPAAQNATASLLISATSAEPLESEPSAFTFDEESQAFGHTDEWVVYVIGSCLTLITSAGNSNSIASAGPLSSPVNIPWILLSKMQPYPHSDGKHSKILPVTIALTGNCEDCRMVLAPLFLMGRD